MNNMKDEIELSESEISEFIEKDAVCWQKANEIVDEEARAKQHCKQKKKKNTIKPSLAEGSHSTVDLDKIEQNTSITVQDLVLTAQTAQKALDDSVIVDIEQAIEVTADGILLVVQQTERWSRMARRFGHRKSVQDATIHLYVQVIYFLQSAREHLERSKWARKRASFFNGVRDEFVLKVSKLRDAADRLDRAANWEGFEHSMDLLGQLEFRIPTATERAVVEAFDACESRKKGESQKNLDITKIHSYIDSMANFVTARPCNFVAAASDAQPKWLKENPKYQTWLDSQSAGMLWIVGKLGCGKSVLAHQTWRHLSETLRTIVTHAFQSNVSTQQRGPNSLAASIISTLLPKLCPVDEFEESILKQLFRLQNQYKSQLEDCPFDDLWPHCVSLLRRNPEFVLIIDALDECIFDNNTKAKEFQSHLTGVLDGTKGKILIFSRPNCMFEVTSHPNLRIDQVEIAAADTQSEINTFIDAAAAELPLPEELKSQVTTRAKQCSEGSFLWTDLFLREFIKTRDMATFYANLNNPPDSHWSFYTKIWKDRLGDMNDDDKSKCQDIFKMLLGARRQFNIDEIEDALDLIPGCGNGHFLISTFCQPLIEVQDSKVRLGHASVRDFLLSEEVSGVGFSTSDPDATLAQKCLEFLLQAIYAQQDRIGQLLRKNLGAGTSDSSQEKGFYEYAARNWYKHLTALSSPDKRLLKLTARFIQSLQFAHWAEYSITDMGDFQAIRSTEISLTVWRKRLPDEDKPLLHLEDYFGMSYRSLHRIFRDNDGDKVLRWLALMQLGFYYFDRGRVAEMADVRERVATGLTELLGRRHPLTLRASSDAAYIFLFINKLRKAQRIYADVAHDQLSVVLESDPIPYFTLILKSQAEHLMLLNYKALTTLTDSLTGFMKTTGPQSNGYLIAQLWYAVATASAGHIEQAIKLMEFVRDKRKEQYGPEDSFGIATQIFVGDLHRKLGAEEEALLNIKPGLKFRHGFWPISHFLTLDTALVLAITYRDFGNEDGAADIIEDLEQNAELDQDQNFVRLCQVKHLRALLLFEGGNLAQPIQMLEEFLINVNEERNNRALQWIRLDLAYMIRYRGEEGDEHLACSLFDGIVTDQSNDPDGEPDPPRWLEIAEKALRLVRFGKTDSANELLRVERLRWAHEETLWMWLGVPAADTGWMRLPKGVGDDNLQ
ncbi:uncharacterized protein FIESC28_01943 [Fusarium coffeatum]|uniref:Nephrocystin 3-like N-terminal domain-containing protein n=1 Tax=Fusarium coffeatum TaxID=231269 RepID=A0A366S8H4_9HYPO|nr:uncharacterized protein FIESC28_01943 [Fusarium coffeatum]RBR25208.1 hypothetical protein FIESC28_01943 [Fusarium coffeatum]